MQKKTILSAALAPVFLSLAGCSVLGLDDMNGETVKYETSAARANLEVPPDLTPIGNDGRFDVPKRPSVISANAENAKRADSAAKSAPAAKEVAQTTKVVKVMHEGELRWINIPAPANQVWTVLQEFWPSVGLSIAKQNATTGFMETNWAENKARLPQDAIRNTIGKVLDFLYSTSERDQYRARIERRKDGSTDVYITHRSMVEVLKGRQAESTIWQPGPVDPTLEADMMQRFAVYAEKEFNPDAKVEKDAFKADLKAPVKEEKNFTIVKDAKGAATSLDINQPFDRAWRTVGVVIDRMGFEVTDRDRAAGYYVVRYLDPKYEAKLKDERGFFKKVFGSDDGVKAPTYRITLEDEGKTTRVVVTDAKGEADKTGVAPTILTLLAEQMI